MKLHHLLLVALFALTGTATFSQPTNDNCANALSLEVGENCEFTLFSTSNATSEAISVAPNPSCGLYAGNDIWFAIEVPATGAFRIEANAQSAGSISYQLYSGSCGNFSPAGCGGGQTNFFLPNLAGQTLHMRVWRANSLSGIDFLLCVYAFNPHPNDNCSGAIQLAVGNECIFQTYSSFYQTTEPGIAPNPSCVGFSGGDVWFKCVMPASGNLRVERNNIPGSINAQFALYTGSCGNMTNLSCAQLTPALNINNPALAGETIHIRVFNYGSAQGGDFQLCVWEPFIPDNDMCSAAFDLQVGVLCQMESYTNAYCTAEPGIAPNPSCIGYSGGDVWFKFQMPASGQIQILRNNIANVNAQWTVYQGSCGNFTQVACAQLINQLNINNPTLAGEILYLRVYNYGSAQGGDFAICVTNTAAPVNDLCANPIPLPVGNTCNPVAFHNVNATAEAGIAPNPTCAGYSGGDVWFTLVVPPSGNVRIHAANVASVNAQMALYSGQCGAMTQVVCGQLQSFIEISNPALVGETLFLRVYNYGSQQGGIFTLCAAEFDCNGDEGGTAYFDNCGMCVGGNTGLGECEPDCAGVPWGAAYIDFCGTCVGGTTGVEPCPAPCLVDFNQNGTVDYGDLVAILVEFGCIGACFADPNGDNVINFSDLAIFLSLYGGICF